MAGQEDDRWAWILRRHASESTPEHEPERRENPGRRASDYERATQAERRARKEVREFWYRVLERVLWVVLAIAALLAGQELPPMDGG